jgi:hypothetical protein
MFGTSDGFFPPRYPGLDFLGQRLSIQSILSLQQAIPVTHLGRIVPQMSQGRVLHQEQILGVTDLAS